VTSHVIGTALMLESTRTSSHVIGAAILIAGAAWLIPAGIYAFRELLRMARGKEIK
jgi:hypothetical protein